MNRNIKRIKFLINEYIKFYESHNREIGELNLKNFRQYIYLYFSNDWVLSCALNDELFNEFLKEIKG